MIWAEGGVISWSEGDDEVRLYLRVWLRSVIIFFSFPAFRLLVKEMY